MTTDEDISTERVGGQRAEKHEKEAVSSSANNGTEEPEGTSSESDVRDQEEINSPRLPKQIPPSALGIAVYSFEGEAEDDLSFPKGAKISDISCPNWEGWWFGTYEGRSGFFPQTCIQFEPSTCRHCAGLISDKTMLEELVSGAGINLRVTRREFRLALEQGCGICVPFYQSVRGYRSSDGPLQSFWVFDYEDAGNDDTELVRNYHATTTPDGGPYDIERLEVTPLGPEDRGNSSILFELYADKDDPASIYVSARPVYWVDASSSMDLASRWISDCLNVHEHCPGPELPLLPTRVIDVGPEDGSEGPMLVLPRGRKACYITLSYCWGGYGWFTLTVANIDKLLQGISSSLLPSTFSEAILVTRALGFRYLWIDALCIIQDSESDKAIEMAMMDQVYHHSSLTICAANASKSSMGFLNICHPRSMPDPYRLAKMNFPLPDGNTGSVLTETEWLYYPAKEPLNKRGWALQERLLSPRVLTFGSFGMYWHCQSKQQCEGGSIRRFVREGAERLDYAFFQRKSDRKISIEVNQVYNNWWDILENYTTRQLTVYTDLLPALSGMAARFATVLNDTYCAGLWRNDLQNGLAWLAGDMNDGPQSRPSGYRAPTWSWASVDCTVRWWHRLWEVKHHAVLHTRILSCEVEPVFPMAPFGEVKSGTIEIHGLVREINWDGRRYVKDPNNGFIVGELHPDVTEEILHDRGDGQGDEPDIFYMGQYLEGMEGPSIGDRIFHRDQEVRAEELARLPKIPSPGLELNMTTRQVSCIPITDNYSLVLECQNDGKYTRLGLLQFWPRTIFQGDPEDPIESFFEGCAQRTLIIR